MTAVGPNYPSTGATLSNAGTSENAEAWVSPGNIVSDNATDASITAATYDTPDISQLLVASGFGFNIAAGSTIDGILVEIDRRCSAGSASDNRVQLSTSTAFAGLVGDNKAATTANWAGQAVASYGGSADTWNAGLTAAQINDAGFAVMLSVQADSTNVDIQVDYIRVTVTYTAGSVSVQPTASSLTLTAQAPTVTVPFTTTPTANSLTLTAGTPTVAVGGGSGNIVRESFATGTDTGVTTSHVVNVPSGVVSGNVLVCVIGWNGSPGTITKPSNWLDVANASTQANPKLNMYLKVSDGTEGSTQTWGTTGSIYCGAIMARYSGVDTTTPQDATAVGTDGAANTAFDLTGLTTATANAMVIAGVACNSSSSANINEANALTEVTEVNLASQRKNTELDDGVQASAGATGTLHYTLNSSLAWAGVVMALRPAAGGGQTYSGVPTAAALTLSVAAPTVVAIGTASAQPTAAALTLTYGTPAVVTPRVALPGAVGLTLTLAAPAVVAIGTALSQPTATALTLAGAVPSVVAIAGVNPQPTAAALSLTPQAPTVAAPYTVSPSARTLTLAGVAPTVTLPYAAAPGAAALTLTAVAPSVVALGGVNPQPTAAALSLSRGTPAVSVPFATTPSSVTLTMTMYAPAVTGSVLAWGVVPGDASFTTGRGFPEWP